MAEHALPSSSCLVLDAQWDRVGTDLQKSQGCQLPSITMPQGRNNLLLVFTREEPISLVHLQQVHYWCSPALTGLGYLCSPWCKGPLALVSPTCPAAQGEMGDSCILASTCSFPTTHVATWSCWPCSLTPSPLSHFTPLYYGISSLCPWKHLK